MEEKHGILKHGSFEDINCFISKGYEPIGTLSFVLKKNIKNY